MAAVCFRNLFAMPLNTILIVDLHITLRRKPKTVDAYVICIMRNSKML